ncbi:MAG: SIMPL domain-containing protein, partial [Lachnospiraceae bacterium]|nr:SIMPL domain-containing protein [Lachnospiraceae bacterium]
KQRLAGYRYTHRMKLEFPSDNERLGKVLTLLASCPGEPEFTIQYTLADPEAAKTELLKKAVEDSKAKAEVLSTAADVKLGEIVNIDYSWGESEIVSPPMRAMALRECKASGAMDNGIAIDIEADDIDVTDTVTVVWSLK